MKSIYKNSKPLLNRLDIELTERCNNNCIHCYINLAADDIKAKKKELSARAIKDILREAVGLGCSSVRFTGGEPLLRDDFEDIYVFSRRQGLRVILFTNATLITRHIAGVFKNIRPLEKIQVTVYGMRQHSYEAVTRSKGSFKAAQKGIKRLLKNNIPFTVKNTLLPQNKNELDDFRKWADSIPWKDKPPLYSISMFLDLSCRRDSVKNKLIKKIRVSPEEGLRVLAYKKEEYAGDMKKFCLKFMHPAGEKIFSCGSGIASGCIDAYGYFQPCMGVRHPEAVYNLKKGSLKDALVNFFPRLREIKAVDPEYLARCARCFLKGLCEQCPAKSWAEHGALDRPVDYFCEVAHAQGRFLGLLKTGEAAWEVGNWQERIRSFLG